ncbi:transcriptional regulatory protein Ash1p [Diutina catenulata]
MSLMEPPAMYTNSFIPGHSRSRSYNELLTKKCPTFTSAIKRPLESAAATTDAPESPANKRSRTAPPSPPYDTSPTVSRVTPNPQYRSRSLSPNKRLPNPLSPSHSPNSSPISSPRQLQLRHNHLHRHHRSVKLPGIASALSAAPLTPKAPIKLKPITPTVSLDYFDTCKPTDEPWRDEVMDSIKGATRRFRDDHTDDKPHFDSRISSKFKPTTLHPSTAHTRCVEERKINFPYESNYTYLNRTYLNDVERYPEYLELAQSLIQLSQPKMAPASTATTTVPSPPPISSPQPPAAYSYSQANYTPPQAAATYPHVIPSLSTMVGQQLPAMGSYPVNPTGYTYNTVHNKSPPASYYSYAAPPEAEAAVSPTHSSKHSPKQGQQSHKFIPITPPSKAKTKVEVAAKSPSKPSGTQRICISCGSDQSPCWRPSWSVKEGQLCNSCGLRYKKTSARCLNTSCKKIPAKGEWSLMQGKGTVQFEDGIEGYSCLECGWRVEVKK